MQVHTLFLLLIPSLCLGYNPSVDEILSQMESKLRQPDPVVFQVIRETPDASLQREHQVRIPAESPEDISVDQDFLFPFSSLTLPKDDILNALPSLSNGDVSVKLDRFQGSICYLLEGRREALWLRKDDFIPLKVESLSASGEQTTYVYTDLIRISEKAVYPDRTEVQRNGSVILVERLIHARSTTGQP